MRFLGTGSKVPDTVLTNDMLSTMVDTSDEWIRARTGILERRIVKDETSLDLSLAAAEAALADAAAETNFTRDHIDMVICATVSNENKCPPLACCLQRDLGLREDILAFDLNAACSGFIYSLIVASKFVAAGATVLIVGCEILSRFVDYTDRSTCILFGDAAGAAIVAPSSDEAGVGFHWVAETKGDDEMLLISDYLYMDGSGVFKFAVEAVIRSIREVTHQAELDPEEIDLFICHQANKRIIESAAKRLKLPQERFFMNLSKYGNTSAASIPLALDEARQSGLVHAGSKIVLAGFGGGLTAGAVCFTWS